MKVSKVKAALSAVAGSITAALGVLGSTSICFCTIPLLAAIFAVLGISVLIFADYHIAFLIIGVLFIALSVFMVIRPGNKRTCKHTPQKKK
ncbi:MAG: hypothetical protein JSV63_04140 [Candidatus Aenigmatarchaeota archaeon]|nr:MAG: hypothetical protein JSV63_04140 [Candidatus Aenigmarchaeota archaeon]